MLRWFEWSWELWWTTRLVSLSQDSKYLPAVIYAALSAPSNLNGVGTQFSQNWTQVLTLLSRVQSQLEMALLADIYCSHKTTDCSII